MSVPTCIVIRLSIQMSMQNLYFPVVYVMRLFSIIHNDFILHTLYASEKNENNI